MLLKIIIAGVVGLVIGSGFMYFALIRLIEVPKVPQLKVAVELAETQYQIGENISVKPYLINMGKRPVAVFDDGPILFIRVYDADKREILRLAEIRLDIPVKRTLSPNVPYKEMYTFALDQPGKYEIVAWAEFTLQHTGVRPWQILIYADPIWIEVIAP
jgi:hypothetical protein